MARLPTPGGDNGNWGEILNEYLSISHAADGVLQAASVDSSQLKTGSVTTSRLDDGAVTRVKLSDGLKDSIDAKLENITGYVGAGTNVSITGLGTLASPYQISSSNAGGDVVGPTSTSANSIARYDGSSGKLIKSTGVYIDDTDRVGVGTNSPNAKLHVVGGAIVGNTGAVTNGGSVLQAYTGNTSNANSGIDVTRGASYTAPDSQFSFRLKSDASGVYRGAIGYATGANASEQMTFTGGGNIGIGTAAPTHSLTLPSTATGVAFYNTADQTTNYERARHYWNGNTYTIGVDAAGTGSNRPVQISSGTSAVAVQVAANGGGTVGAPKVLLSASAGGGSSALYQVVASSTLSASSGGQSTFAVSSTVNQSSTASYTAFLVNAIETATGTGSKLLADFQVGGTSKTRIDNSGTHTMGSGAGIVAYNTADETTNYERVTAAWSSNIYNIGAEAGGTGSFRSVRLSSSNTNFTVSSTGSPAFFAFNRGTSGANAVGINYSGTWNAASGTNAIISVTPVINQSATAGYVGLLVNPTETGTGSGSKLLADFQVGGTSKTRIDNTGSHVLSNGAMLDLYNTTDETTNYERVRSSWSGNIYSIAMQTGGTGVGRAVSLSAVQGSGNTNTATLSINRASIPFFSFTSGGTSLAGNLALFNSTFTGTTGTQTALAVNPTVNQSSAAGYTALLVNPTETTTGSGSKLLADFQVASASKFKVANDGLVTATNRITNVSDPTNAQDVATKNYVDTTRFEVLQAMGNVTGATSVNVSLAPNFSMTLTGNTTLTFTNVPTGSKVVAVTLYVTQDATGSRTLEITGRKGAFGANALANLSATAGAMDEIIARTLDGGTSWVVSMGAQSIS